MQKRLGPFAAAAVVAAAAVACDDGASPDRQRLDAVSTRIAELERRVGGVERSVEPVARLNDETARLDRRLSATEAGLRELAARTTSSTTTLPHGAVATTTTTLPAPGARTNPRGPAAWGGTTTRDERERRRAELRTLTHEFRERLSEVRPGRGGTMTGDEQQKTQELLQWYRDQRRAILSGEGRSDQ